MASKLSRLGRLGALTTRVTGSYVGQAVTGLFKDEESRERALQRLHLDNAREIVGQLGALKGAAMKVGQQFAQLADGVALPEEAKAILAKLHDKAEPVPFEDVRARVEEELGAGIDTRFRRFDPTPLGTASLGQAHAAELPDGTPVVVKVLHRGVEDTVDMDLGAFKSMLLAGRFVRRPREELDAILAEVGARIQEELDYRKEADNLESFAGFFAGDPDVRVPAVHREWSTARVLTMERLGGVPLAAFQEQSDEAARQRAGALLAESFFRMLYLHRGVHADPHPGNYLFQPDGRIGILDFGCVRRFDPAWVVHYGACGMAARHDDRESCMVNGLAIGALTRRDPEEEGLLWEVCRTIGVPFRGGPYAMGGPEDDVMEKIARITPRLVASRTVRAPHEMVFLHRGLGGVYQLTRALRARQDWGAMFERIYLDGRARYERETASVHP
jgi:aarF domain-containing kinase